MRFIVSTVGISLLNNLLNEEEVKGDWRKCFNNRANITEKELAKEKNIKTKLMEVASRAKHELDQGDVKKNRRLSAELNGIYGIYNGSLKDGKNDIHYLVATDTAQGGIAAHILLNFLKTQGITNVNIYVPENLSTLDTNSFTKGIKKLVRWCEEVIPPHKSKRYEILFNLVGGFKSLQGYLNIIGMFYADRIVYIFEAPSAELITIPRLPIKLDLDLLKPYVIWLSMMAEGYLCPLKNLRDLPEALIDSDETHAFLSTWGELAWVRVKDELLANELWSYPKLSFKDSFKRDFDCAEHRERIRLQETLAKVATIIEQDAGNLVRLKADGGLQYDDYTNKKIDGKPISHFRVSQGIRVSCQTKDGQLILRRFGKEEEINKNP